MTKLVVLELIGDSIDCGFESKLEIGSVGCRPQLRERGTLPANPQLQDLLQQHWQNCYGAIARQRSILTRLKPKIISHGDDRDRCRESARELERQFQTWLASESFRNIDRRLREAVNPDEDIRLAIASDRPELRKLPWHLWDFCQRYPGVEATFAPLSGSTPPTPTGGDRDRPLKILAILGNDEGIDIDADRRFLENLPDADTTFLVAPQRQALHDRLWERHWDIIFFAGHSQTEDGIGRLYINAEESLSLDELRYGLQKAIARGLQLAIFNSCDGLGLATALGDCAIPHTIVMREDVPDPVAQAFLKGFLAAFSQGRGFHGAVRDARERLQGLEDRFPCASWLPVIVQHPDATPPVWRTSPKQPDFLPSSRGQTALKLAASLLVAALALGANSWGRDRLGGWLHQQAIAAYGDRRLGSAEDLWRWSVRVDPQRRSSLLMLGYLHEHAGDEAAAERLYQQSARRGLPAAYRRLSEMTLRHGGDPNRAASLAERGLALVSADVPPQRSGRVELLTTLAWARWQQGFTEEAVRLLDEVLASPKFVVDARCLYGEILHDRGESQTARYFWQQCATAAESGDLDEERWRQRALQRLAGG